MLKIDFVHHGSVLALKLHTLFWCLSANKSAVVQGPLTKGKRFVIIMFVYFATKTICCKLWILTGEKNALSQFRAKRYTGLSNIIMSIKTFRPNEYY